MAADSTVTVTLTLEQFNRLDDLADWIERDRREPDKVFAYAQDLRSTLYRPRSAEAPAMRHFQTPEETEA